MSENTQGRRLKFLHCSDIHIDSPYTGMTPDKSDERRRELRATFMRLMEFIRERGINYCLISGDLFDKGEISPETEECVLSAFGSLSCPVIIAPGNHDPYNAISLYHSGELPENVYVFSSEEMQIFDLDEIGVSVCGYAFMTDRLETSPISSFVPRRTAYPLVLCAHADLGATFSKYAPVSTSDIERCNFAYAALGHIHNEPEGLPENIKYCGFPTGRSFDELGDGGAYLVTLDGEKVSTERIVFSEHRFMRDRLDVSEVQTSADIEKLIRAYVQTKGYGGETSLCLELCGTLPLSLAPDLERLAKADTPLRQLKLKDATTALPDTKYLEEDLTLRGELYRTLLPKLNSPDADERKCATLALRLGLSAIDGQNLSDLLGIEN